MTKILYHTRERQAYTREDKHRARKDGKLTNENVFCLLM